MSAIDLISDDEKLMLEAYIKEYGPMDTSYFNWDNWKGLPTILQEWDKEKSKALLPLLDNKLILSRPYSYLAQEDAISLEINKHISNDPQPRTFFRWFEEATHKAENDIEIFDFHGNNLIDDNKRYHYSKWFEIRDCMTSATLAANKYLGNEVIIQFKSGHKMKIFKGMKPMKVLHTLIKEFNGSEEMFDEFRIWHSMLLNQKRVDGELCVSIHPMDYITMSDNDNDWKSCMRWTSGCASYGDHGDYRSGTVQCLNSPYIVIAYLHNKNHLFNAVSDYYWNSKQWRELFIVQDGVINEIKGYPFQDENLTQTVLMWLKELAQKNLGWEYEDEEVDVSKEIKPNTYLTYEAGDFMYKDIGSLLKHSGRINFKKLLSDKYSHHSYGGNSVTQKIETFITIPYGGVATCMSCGNYLETGKSEIVLCPNCDYIRTCPCCGEPITNEDYYYIDELDNSICYECYNDKAGIDCFDDSVSHLYENMDELYLLLGYDEDMHPIFFPIIAYTYDIMNNWGIQDTFKEKPKDDLRCYYVTYDMVRNDSCAFRVFYDAFDIYPRNWNKFYEAAIRDYDIYYNWNKEKINF